jgi:hypothetical protein
MQDYQKFKEWFNMNKIIKYGMVGLAGYLIGHYEMKYKVLKWAWKTLREKEEVEQEKKEEGAP